MKSFGLIVLLLIVCSTVAIGQKFYFSQNNFASQKINFSGMGVTNYTQISMNYRQQTLTSGLKLKSTYMDLSYPFTRGKRNWSNIGLSVLDDRFADGFSWVTQDVAISYAVNIPVKKGQFISFGSKILFQTKYFSFGQLATGTQYVKERGFDLSKPNGESGDTFRANLLSLNFGLRWQRLNKRNTRTAFAEVAIFDTNSPRYKFIRNEQENPSLSFTTGFLLHSRGQINFIPEFFWIQNNSFKWMNAGLRTKIHVGDANHIDLISMVSISNVASLGVQIHKPGFSFGISYDLPIANRRIVDAQVFELGIMMRSLVSKSTQHRAITSSVKKPIKQVENNRRQFAKTPSRNIKIDSVKNHTEISSLHEDSLKRTLQLTQRIKQKQDSILRLNRIEKKDSTPHILDTKILRFGFDSNSTAIDNSDNEYLDELAHILLENHGIVIQIIGHTDNVGSSKFNMKLSIQRAEAVKACFVDKGVKLNQLHVEGRGLTEPLNTNTTNEERGKNRRVEIVILYLH